MVYMTVQLMTYNPFEPRKDWISTSAPLASRVKNICRTSLCDCELIENPKDFIKSYKQQLEQELCDFDHIPQQLMDWGEYNVEEITNPKSDGSNLTFYVKNQRQIPLKVTVDCFNNIECGPLPLLN